MSESDLTSPVSEDIHKIKAAGTVGDDSSDETDSSEIQQNGVSESTSSSESSGPGVNGENQLGNGTTDTDTEEDVMEKEETSKEETAVTAVSSFSQAEEPELKPKKAPQDSDSSETEDEAASDAEIDGSAASKTEPDFEDENAREIDDMIKGLKSDSPEPQAAPVVNVVEAAEGTLEDPAEEEEDEPSIDQTRSPSPPLRSPSPEDRSRSSSPERKDSRGSHGSSSLDEERASSLSPEPPKVIATPSTKVMSPVTSPVSPRPTSQNRSPITKIYTDKILPVDSDGETEPARVARQKPASDITQIYTQKLGQSDSPKPERASRVKPSRDITQLYTAALHKEDKSPSRVGDLPKRTGDITKLYTGGLGGADSKPFKGKPNDERTAPTKHNMATAVDRDAIKEAYLEVMADNNGIEWATFIFKDNKLGVTAKGSQFNEFKTQFGPDDRGFGYMKVMTGDEMSKRSKFVFCTWVGPNVSVMKKAKMSTDKALMKELIQNLSVELQVENANEFSMDHFKAEVDKAGGARYGTGVRDH